MRLLLDTNAFFWWLVDDERLGAAARSEIEVGDVYASAVVIWELGIKAATRKLVVPEQPIEAALAEGFRPLAIRLEHAYAAAALPPIHRDPFDRMLVAQARLEGLTLVTADGVIPKYDVKVLAT